MITFREALFRLFIPTPTFLQCQEPGGGTKSGKVRVCEAGPPDPLPPSVRNSLKKTPPSIRSAAQHV